MTQRYNFKLGHHGDVILRSGERCFNLGYNYVSEFPIVPWLCYFQVSRENLFEDMKMLSRKKIEEDLEELISKTINVAKKLPLQIESFNMELCALGIGHFYPGSNRNPYEWQLSADTNLYLVQDAPVLVFSQKDIRLLIEEYMEFLGNEERLSFHNDNVQEIIERLKELS